MMIDMTDSTGIGSVRGRSFGAAAADFDRYRPRYPDQLVEDVVAMVPGRRVLEVGAGTGIATAGFAARGMAMTCVEPDAQMAAMLSAKLPDDADLHVDVATFEEWSAARPPGAPGFDALIQCAGVTLDRSEDALGRRGRRGPTERHVALFWNEDHHADPPGHGRVHGRLRPPWHRDPFDSPGVGAVIRPGRRRRPETSGRWPEVHAELDEYFTNLRTYQCHWADRMSVADYVARIDTTSAHLILPSEARDDLTVELIAALTGYGDEIELAMTTDLAMAVHR
jgi:SAM-dependent methyltransferase